MFAKRCLLVLVALCLFLWLVPACGGGKEETTPTSAPTFTLMPTLTQAPTPITSSTEPVKIGVISSWSGPLAMSGGIANQVIAVVEQQVKDMGGILGGRQVKFVRGDDGSTLAGVVGQARKLALEENADMLAFGGFNGSCFNAVAQAAEELKIPYVSPATIYDVATMKYTICLFTSAPYLEREANFV